MTKDVLNRREAALAMAGGIVAGAAALAATPAAAEPQPMMASALGNLNKALADLQLATADKAGHRVKAIAATRNAIAEVQAGIAADNRR
ncbi:MAG: hypothetical protein U1E56_01525 [Bauldia sp.]